MNPLFNLREICKQSSLLEDHLNNERKRCPDCIRKHFLTIEALFEEAISLDKLLKHEALLQGKAEGVRKLQERWLDCQKFNDEKKNSALLQISQDLRKMRKEFAPLCFDTREMVSVEKQASLSVCPHRKKVATFILTAKDKQVISSFITRGHDLDGDYVSLVGGSLVTMTGRTLAIEDPEGDGFISPIGDYSLVDNKIISIVSRLADELGLEFGVEVSSGEDFRVRLASLGNSLDKMATLSQTEKEDRSIESRIHKSPKNKPPRYDLRAKTKVEDPDLENLGGAAGGDRDLSMNHKKVASRFLRGQ
jgi:hypothetical protein